MSSQQEDDAAWLRRSASNLDDLDAHTVNRAKESFRYAYERARRISEGTLDPLSA